MANICGPGSLTLRNQMLAVLYPNDGILLLANFGVFYFLTGGCEKVTFIVVMTPQIGNHIGAVPVNLRHLQNQMSVILIFMAAQAKIYWRLHLLVD